eukprot:2230684-Prymnesium_polylepis.2
MPLCHAAAPTDIHAVGSRRTTIAQTLRRSACLVSAGGLLLLFQLGALRAAVSRTLGSGCRAQGLSEYFTSGLTSGPI